MPGGIELAEGRAAEGGDSRGAFHVAGDLAVLGGGDDPGSHLHLRRQGGEEGGARSAGLGWHGGRVVAQGEGREPDTLAGDLKGQAEVVPFEPPTPRGSVAGGGGGAEEGEEIPPGAAGLRRGRRAAQTVEAKPGLVRAFAAEDQFDRPIALG